MEKLAINGGKPVRAKPFPARKPFGKEEIKELAEAVNSQVLFRNGGTKVERLEQEFAKKYGAGSAIASVSGTSAIHIAVGAINPDPGDEIITAPITDIGTVIGILYQNAIPVFADIDPDSYNMDPADIEKRITKRTKAIIVVHLLGNPVDMDAVMKTGRKHGIPVIEDCSQAYLTYYKGRLCGAIGDIGCFSMQQSKHLTAGDGGITITSNKKYAERMKLFANKGLSGSRVRGLIPASFLFLAPNYRMNELTGAVALAQLGKLEKKVEKRRMLGDLLTGLISNVRGIRPLKVIKGCRPTYWQYGFKVLDACPEEFAKALTAEGVFATAGYIGRPIYTCSEAMRSKTTYGRSHCPFDCPHADSKIEYNEKLCPVTEKEQPRLILTGIHEDLSKKDVGDIAKAIAKVANTLS